VRGAVAPRQKGGKPVLPTAVIGRQPAAAVPTTEDGGPGFKDQVQNAAPILPRVVSRQPAAVPAEDGGPGCKDHVRNAAPVPPRVSGRQ